MQKAFVEVVRRTARSKILFLPHALDQMNRPERLIDPDEVKMVVNHGEIIEDYPDDPRGHSCLMSGRGESNRPIHVVCSPKKEYLALITAYLPDPAKWTDNFRKRR